MLGQVQLLLQLGIDRFTDQAQLNRLRLIWLGADGRLSFFHRSEEFERALLFQISLKTRVIVGPISKQMPRG